MFCLMGSSAWTSGVYDCRCSLSNLYESQQEKDAAGARAILEVMCSPVRRFVEIKTPCVARRAVGSRGSQHLVAVYHCDAIGCPQSLHLGISDLIQLQSRGSTRQSPAKHRGGQLMMDWRRSCRIKC